jgi:hypothetical protein
MNYTVIIPKVMVKLIPQTRSLKHYSLNWLMKIGMTKMSTCSQYFFILNYIQGWYWSHIFLLCLLWTIVNQVFISI